MHICMDDPIKSRVVAGYSLQRGYQRSTIPIGRTHQFNVQHEVYNSNEAQISCSDIPLDPLLAYSIKKAQPFRRHGRSGEKRTQSLKQIKKGLYTHSLRGEHVSPTVCHERMRVVSG